MGIRRGLEWFGGSVVVYLAVAACGSEVTPGRPVAGAGTGSAGLAAGAMGGSSGGAGELGTSGQLASAGESQDAGGGRSGAASGAGTAGTVMHPVPDASAQEGGAPGCTCEAQPYVPPEPEVVMVDCADGIAELERDEGAYWLDRTLAFGIVTASTPLTAAGYSEFSAQVARRNGRVATSCLSNPVRFVLFPR